MEHALELVALEKRFYTGFLAPLPGLRAVAPRQLVRRVEALKGLSLQVPEGSIFGFLGPNGAGKTTTLKVLTDLVRPSGGAAYLLGAPPGDRRVRAQVGFLPEQARYPDQLSARELLELYGRLFSMSAQSRRRETERRLAEVEMSEAADRPLRKLSKGMLQRVGLAQALLNSPRLLLLDEPFSGLDPSGRRLLRELIAEEHRRGMTVFFSSHILADVELLCDRFAIVSGGRVRRSGEMSALLKETGGSVTLSVDRCSDTLRASIESQETHQLERRGGAWLIRCPEAALPALLQKLFESGSRVLSLQSERASLESLYLETLAEEKERP